ncbi:uncharacterized protein LOC117287761 [Asterias rubens]|uniref:uncharacterized protein LOC117287761 n=1 Tax=Asterias rubens TaxID=7604 RepID=UPI0014552B98|nr:uncharacterized protein LOC117287761 [Asterias rubens]
MVQQAQERCLLRCKRTDPAENQPNWQQSSTRKEDKQWSDVTELQSGDSQCLFDDVYRTFTPVWQERIIKLLKEAVADSTM